MSDPQPSGRNPSLSRRPPAGGLSHTGDVTNSDLIVLLGLAVALLGLALAVPAGVPRPGWTFPLIGVVAAVLGLLAAVTVWVR